MWQVSNGLQWTSRAPALLKIGGSENNFAPFFIPDCCGVFLLPR